MAGMLEESGYYMGREFWEPRDSNPKGFFEDREINQINEDLIAQAIKVRPSGILGRLFRSRPAAGQRWLAEVPLGAPMLCPSKIAQRIEAQVTQKPFCFKDPRFCYTLPAWYPLISEAGFICVFREPGRTVNSILKECRTQPYLKSLSISFERAMSIWTLMYKHILQVHRKRGDWMFVHYDQLIEGTAVSRVEEFLGAACKNEFADPNLKRSPQDARITDEALAIYEQLCDFAGFSGVSSEEPMSRQTSSHP